MDEEAMMESRMQSAAAFVEGGIQDSCDDSCSICLEVFCDSDPPTVTNCKHEFHLHCILEWCQRSSQCPMCWQNITLMDSTSQELLDAVVRERIFRATQNTNTTIFRHPTFGEFEVQHLPAGATDADLEERIIQHLAAAAAIRRSHHGSRRGLRTGSGSSQGRPQFLVFSTTTSGEGNSSASANIPVLVNQHSTRPTRSFGESTPVSHDRAGPSDFHAFSECWKSRLNAVSTRYKESISKSTRGWKERFFSRGASMAEFGSEVRREVSAGIATVSRMMERIDIRENSSPATSAAAAAAAAAARGNAGEQSVTDGHESSATSSGTR